MKKYVWPIHRMPANTCVQRSARLSHSLNVYGNRATIYFEIHDAHDRTSARREEVLSCASWISKYIVARLPYTLSEWLNLALRWTHVFAGILWIGQTYFFIWLDHRLREEGNVWMVHSGGFYIVQKQGADVMLPQRLHWFKWEAALTWLSGFFLLGLVYYGGGLMVDDSVRRMPVGAAAGLSIAWLIVAWIV